jgi:hypothetical protein
LAARQKPHHEGEPALNGPAAKEVYSRFTWGRPVSTWVAKLQVRTEVLVPRKTACKL